MLCSNCQRPLPDDMICGYCSDAIDDELMLSPVEDLPRQINSGLGGFSESSKHMDFGFAQEIHLQPEERVQQVICRKCNAAIPAGRLQCASCGYNPQLSREFDPLELDEFDGAMGFERFLMKHTSQNDPGNLILWFRIFIVFLLAVYIVTARDLISLVISAAIVGCYVGYLLTLGQQRHFHAGRSVIPSVILLVNRLSRWGGIAEDSKGLGSIITRRGGRFGDEDLASIEDTAVVEVLDIPSTAITDTGVLYLQGFPNLKGLNVQGCQVSDDSLDALQRVNKSVLIWR